MKLKQSRFLVRVLGPGKTGVSTATVTVASEDRVFRLECETKPGDYTTAGVIPKGDYLVSVSKKPYETDTRKVTIGTLNEPEVFFLRKEGTPFYYRGKVKVPFTPDENKIVLFVQEYSTLGGGKGRTSVSIEQRIGIGNSRDLADSLQPMNRGR